MMRRHDRKETIREQSATRSEIGPEFRVGPGRCGSGTGVRHGLPRGRNRRKPLLGLAWALLLSAVTPMSSAWASDVTVTMLSSTGTCFTGDVVTFTVGVTGDSARVATIVFPQGLALIPASLPANCSADAVSPTTVTCSLSGAGTMVLSATAVATGQQGVVAGAAGNDHDPNLSNNSAVRTVTVYQPVGTKFYTLTPCRAIDTRASSGFPPGYGPPSMSGNQAQRSFTLAGRCGIPTDARSVSINAAVWGPVTTGDMAIFAAGGTTAGISMLFWKANILALANAGFVQLGSGGTITVQVNGTGTVDLFLDVNGYFK